MTQRPTVTERNKPVIQITPAMLDAGVEALMDSDGSSTFYQAKMVFEAMTKAACFLPAKQAANDHDADVTRLCLATLESGVKALVKITGFTYVDGVPLALGEGVTETISAAELTEIVNHGITNL